MKIEYRLAWIYRGIRWKSEQPSPSLDQPCLIYPITLIRCTHFRLALREFLHRASKFFVSVHSKFHPLLCLNGSVVTSVVGRGITSGLSPTAVFCRLERAGDLCDTWFVSAYKSDSVPIAKYVHRKNQTGVTCNLSHSLCLTSPTCKTRLRVLWITAYAWYTITKIEVWPRRRLCSECNSPLPSYSSSQSEVRNPLSRDGIIAG